MIFRPIKHQDLDGILTIEKQSFKSAWSRSSFENELSKEYGVNLVFEEFGIIIAYIFAWIIMDELHITNLAVHPDYRRKGIARKLVQSVIQMNNTAHSIHLEVRENNIPARNLYRHLGFKSIGIRRNYYESENEDAIVMIREMN